MECVLAVHNLLADWTLSLVEMSQTVVQIGEELIEYIKEFENNKKLKCLFNQSHISRLFRNSPIRVKDLRKFFSQEWDRQGGVTTIKKIIMSHSLKGDVDLMHYNYQSPEDLKKIYDKVMGNLLLFDNEKI